MLLFLYKYFFENNNNIKVYDGLKYINDNPNEKLDSALINYNYLLNLFDFIKKNDKPDYILIDGSEKMTNIAEYCMRKNNSIKLYGGIANLNLWKERKDYLISIHKKALNSAVSGLIYTTYTDKEEIIEEGTIISKQKIPKWTGIILEESDIVIHVSSNFEKGKGKKFNMRVMNSKIEDVIQTGLELDITGKESLSKIFT